MSAKSADHNLGDQEDVMPPSTNSLCCPVTGNVGNFSPDDFYELFMLDSGNDYAEFSFEEMKEIYHYRGMDYWPLLTDTLHTSDKVKLSDTSCLIYLVSINAQNSLSSTKWGRNKADKAGMALNKIQKLYQKILRQERKKMLLEKL